MVWAPLVRIVIDGGVDIETGAEVDTMVISLE